MRLELTTNGYRLLRNEYFAEYGPQIYRPDRTFVVASLALTPDELALPEPLAPWIRTLGDGDRMRHPSSVRYQIAVITDARYEPPSRSSSL